MERFKIKKTDQQLTKVTWVVFHFKTTLCMIWKNNSIHNLQDMLQFTRYYKVP